MLLAATRVGEFWQTSRDVDVSLSCGCINLTSKSAVLVNDHITCDWFIVDAKGGFFLKIVSEILVKNRNFIDTNYP